MDYCFDFWEMFKHIVIAILFIFMIVYSFNTLNTYNEERLAIVSNSQDFQTFEYCEKITNLYYCK